MSTKNLDPEKYPSNITFVDNVDARRLHEPGYLDALGGKKFDDIVFNAPRAVPGWKIETGKLIDDVLDSGQHVLNPGGVLRFSSSEGMPGGWKLKRLFDNGKPGFQVQRPVRFLDDPFLAARITGPKIYMAKRLIRPSKTFTGITLFQVETESL